MPQPSQTNRTANIAEIKGLVKISYEIRQPMLVLGDPGLGKSQSFAQAAGEMGVQFSDLRTTLIDPVDLRGLPDVDRENRITRWLQPEFLPQDGEGILLLDELPAASPMVQSALLQLVLDRRIGDYVLPDGWCVFAAGNYASNRSGSSKLNKALASRFLQVHARADVPVWSTWANESGLAPEIVAFINYRPDLLHAFDARSEDAFPCPRSWSFASRYVASVTDRSTLGLALEGFIGPGATSEFLGFLDIALSLRSPEVYLTNPEHEPLPKANETSSLYALTLALAAKACKDNAESFFTLMRRLPKEFGWLGIKSATERDSVLLSTKGYVDFVVENDQFMG